MSTGSLATTRGLADTVGASGRRIRSHGLTPYLFILPAVLLEGVFFGYPLVRTLWMSLHDWPMLGTQTFVGLGNYSDLLADAGFWRTLRFTVLYTVLVTPPIFLAGTALALLVDRRLRGITLFRSIYFVPVVISLVSVSYIWLWIYHDLYGLFNWVLRSLGVIDEPIFWMGGAETSLPAIILMVTWKTAGFTMVLLLAGLQSIPQDLYEAAALDGARWGQQLRHLTLPLLRPSFALALIVSIIGSFLAFEPFVIMTHGGPANSTRTVLMYIYETSFGYFRLGSGSAMAVVLLGILVAFSAIQLRLLNRPVDY